MLVGSLAEIRRYPIKSLCGEHLDCAQIGRDGLVGDRTRAFFVRAGGRRIGNTYRGKENDELHLLRRPKDAHNAAARRGVEVELRDGERFFDAAAISVIVDGWLNDLSRHVGYAVQWQRFRPNFFVTAASDFNLTESALIGTALCVGDVRLTVQAPISRCVVTTYDPHGNGKDPEVLRFIANQRDNIMGIYCDVISAGRVRIGDRVSSGL